MEYSPEEYSAKEYVPREYSPKDTSSGVEPDDRSDASDYDSDFSFVTPSISDDDGDEPSTEWGQKRLMKLLNNVSGAPKRVIRYVEKYLKSTKLIFVVGQTGTGKSTILQELTGLDLNIGYTLKSGTRKYEICPAFIDGQQYLFVDTAGFGAADMDDMANYYNIMSCLEVLGPFVTVAGLIFVYGKMENRLRKEDLKTIQWVQCFCGPKFFRNVIFVTNHWDTWHPKTLERTWNKVPELLGQEDIKRILNPPGRYRGGSVYHHGFPGGKGSTDGFEHILDLEENKAQRRDELRKLIRQHYANATGIKLQVAREMESGVPISETEAARVLREDPFKTEIHIQKGHALMWFKSDGAQVSSPARETQSTPSTSELQVQHKQLTGSELSTSDSSSVTHVGKPYGNQIVIYNSCSPNPPSKEDRQGTKNTEDEDPAYAKSWWQRAFQWLKAAFFSAGFFRSHSNQEIQRSVDYPPRYVESIR
ncbi:P-loop containing nucleoside triphosphate hydrolase protein [Daldinia caldariorum]|uniref:P-loop containing nucleoside triphosphate hydrolase protein n=1 Tax=Daldinia caldariorum TaxID=326644 RepID=UPI00200737D1|nr:P-loop containing nucleoside triphosphate hydrolase protein [Daldinia caldariorum]KAI1466181.1 P-loop containing nucleoside triphosphate hydrolase protein [Daldinia caldariorum]